MSIEIAREWIKASSSDLRTISKIIDDEYLTHIVAFHAQQSIEKSLKAYLAFKSKKIPKVHKLQTLFDLTEIEFLINEDTLQLLDKLYIESRYPGDMGLLPYGNPTIEDAQEFHDFVENIFEKICQILDIDISEIIK